MNSMFDTLLLLPLFQGLAQEDFTKILGKVKLHFTKHKKREVIAAKGSPCRELIFVLRGEVSVTSASDAPAYSLTETLPAPWVIEPQSLFGMQTAYAADYVSTEETSTISIDKLAVINELFKYDIFRLNYMNMVSNRAQQLYERLWRSCTGTLEERIAAFMLLHADAENHARERLAHHAPRGSRHPPAGKNSRRIPPARLTRPGHSPTYYIIYMCLDRDGRGPPRRAATGASQPLPQEAGDEIPPRHPCLSGKESLPLRSVIAKVPPLTTKSAIDDRKRYHSCLVKVALLV